MKAQPSRIGRAVLLVSGRSCKWPASCPWRLQAQTSGILNSSGPRSVHHRKTEHHFPGRAPMHCRRFICTEGAKARVHPHTYLDGHTVPNSCSDPENKAWEFASRTVVCIIIKTGQTSSRREHLISRLWFLIRRRYLLSYVRCNLQVSPILSAIELEIGRVVHWTRSSAVQIGAILPFVYPAGLACIIQSICNGTHSQHT